MGLQARPSGGAAEAAGAAGGNAAAAAAAAASGDDAARQIQAATAQAATIVADARRVAAAEVAAARAEVAAARAEAERIRAEAERIRADAERIRAEARAGRGGGGLGIAIASGRTSAMFFFLSELVGATGDFSEAHRIGGGGFGSVYQTDQLRGLGVQWVAVKKLASTSMQGPMEFLQEAQVLGGCRHPNLTVLLGVSADTSAVCLVTPLMRGGSLEDRLMLDAAAQRRLAKLPGAPAGGFAALSWEQRLIVAVDALAGLLHLHTPGQHKPCILHRDIKLSNILLDLDGHARLADMGLARAQRPGAEHLTTVTSIAGTNGYLDEVYVNYGTFDASADGYAMGVTLLGLLTAKPAVDPARGHIIGLCEVDDASELASIVDERAQWPTAVAGEVHKAAMGLVKRNRERRITVSAALERLQALADTHLPRAPAAEDLVERECMMCMMAHRHVRFGCGHSALCRGCVGFFMQSAAPACLICRRRVTEEELIVNDDVAHEDTFVRPRRA